MTFYGRLIGSVAALAVIGAGAAYAADECADVLADAKELVSDAAACFIIKEHNGKVALFREGESEPAAVYATALTQINPADAALLHDGIRLRGMSEVSRLLEDLEIE